MLIINVDFFSSGKVAGWTNAKILNCSEVTIKTNTGEEKEITNYIDVYRQDVNNKYNYDASEPTGFNINLFDLFNNRVEGFDILIDGFKVWSSSLQIEKLKSSNTLKEKRFFEVGGRRLIILYDKDSWLDKASGRLNSWNTNQFNKAMNNGVAISFMNIEELRKNIKNTDFSRSNNIFIIEREAVRESIILSNDIPSYPVLIMEEILNTSLDYSGLLGSVMKINGYTNQTVITPSELREIIDSITTYCEMFFDTEYGSLLYVSGKSSVKIAATIRTLNDEKQPFKGCIVISKSKINRLSDFNKDTDVIFINSALLRNTYDIINIKPLTFLDTCLKRGIKVKNITLDEEK